MARVKFLEPSQSEFLKRIKINHNLGWPDIASTCKVHTRTLFDWRRNKYQMDYASFKLLRSKFRIYGPRIEIFPDDWNIKNAARLGALRRNELYGPPVQ